MRIVRFDCDGQVGYGILEDDWIQVLADFPGEAVALTGERIRTDTVRLLAPATPPNVLAIGLNYRQHARETGKELPDHPLLFIKATTAVIGPGDPIVLPVEHPDEVDYEAELAMVIGRTARRVPVDQALAHVLGFTCANDVSARDCQLRLDGQWARGKSFDTFCPLGPWIETELDPAKVAVSSHLNGTPMQHGNTADLIFGCAELIAHLSQAMTLLPGTVILTGTPAGVGVARKPPVFLRPGDTIAVTVDGVGTLRNPVVSAL